MGKTANLATLAIKLLDLLALFKVLRENTLMNMNSNTCLSQYHREEIWHLYNKDKITVTSLTFGLNVSRPMIYKALKLYHNKLFKSLLSKNER